MDDQLNKDGANSNSNPVSLSSDPVQGAPAGTPEQTPAPEGAPVVPGGPIQESVAGGMPSDPVQGAPAGTPEQTPAPEGAPVVPGGVTQAEPVKTDDSTGGNA